MNTLRLRGVCMTKPLSQWGEFVCIFVLDLCHIHMRVFVHCISAVWILNVQFAIQATPCTNKRITLNSGWVYALHMILELAILRNWLGML